MSTRLRIRVLSQFEEWARAHGLVPESPEAAERWRTRIAMLLQNREDYLERPDPTLWRSGDVHTLLLDHLPQRQFDRWELAEHAVENLREFLRFLDVTDRFHPASAKTPALLSELDRLAPKFSAAMADVSRYRLAKRVLTAALAEGVDLDDTTAVDAWARELSGRDYAGRRQVLGDLMDQHPGYATGAVVVHEGQVAVLRPGAPASKHLVWPDAPREEDDQNRGPIQVYAPVAIPDEHALAQEVSRSGRAWLDALHALVTAVGSQGLAVDRRAEPAKADLRRLADVLNLHVERANRLADMPRLRRLWDLAREFGFLEVRRTRVVPGPEASVLDRVVTGSAADDGETLGLWDDLYETLFGDPDADTDRSDDLRLWTDHWAPLALGLLYEHTANGEDCVDLGDLTDELLASHPEDFPSDDDDDDEPIAFLSALATMAIRHALAAQQRHGTVEVLTGEEFAEAVATAPDSMHRIGTTLGAPLWALLPLGDVRVRLTALGRYAVRRRLLAEGAQAPRIS
ncbi:hypothetical protein [Streptomyces gibsoniae]|uniref:TIGR02678 family protein n=1 Tax=Streptomyces gibsoniae TaxID=3075529 RepID=A0ABU2U567_9ACTN|nr:hypothetical protein [Streptomyces sp. DSM 41699]MDT0468379.1 hypothetical protein [Streptomyces sp. DSM 41699]